jgi:hypothetical protein
MMFGEIFSVVGRSLERHNIKINRLIDFPKSVKILVGADSNTERILKCLIGKTKSGFGLIWRGQKWWRC